MPIDLEMLGMTQEELRDRVVDRIAEKAMGEYSEEEGDAYKCSLETAVKDHLRKMLSDAVERLGEKHIVPNVLARLEKMTLQATNEWGERTRGEVSFTQYMVQRADSYLNEKVTSEGRVPDNYHRAEQTRITWLLDQHFNAAIQSALSAAAELMRKELAQGIGEAVKLQLEGMLAKLKVTAET